MGNTVARAQQEAAKTNAAAQGAQRQLELDVAKISIILDAKEEQYKMKLITPKSEKRIDATMGPSSNLDQVVESAFGGSFLSALKGLVLGVLGSVIGSAQVGEKEKVGMTVILLHSAVVRCDYYVYAYTSASEGGATAKKTNGLVFVATLSTVKLSNVNTEAIALLSGLTAEQGIAHINFLKMSYERFARDIKRDKHYYVLSQALGYIDGYFGDLLSEPQKTQLATLYEIDTQTDKTIAAANALTKQEDANSLLSLLATSNSVPQSDEKKIMEKQQELLETMTIIYEKIAAMKQSTQTSIMNGEKRIKQY
jgi:hypothetical protein